MRRFRIVLLCAVLAALTPPGAPCTAEEPTAPELTAPEFNKLAGTPIFGEGDLWRRPPHELIWRLNVNCRAEKIGDGQMFSAPLAREVFGCRAVELRIFAAGGAVTRIEFIMINKGDGSAGKGRYANIKNKMRRSRSDLEKLLRADFGRPRRLQFAVGAMKRQLPVWTCGLCMLAMDYSDGEYLMLRLLPPDTPTGRPSADKDKTENNPGKLKDYSARVKRLPNGDVFIDGVPMVNQGNKGYCVPATVERVVRYFGIDGVDMHKLAEKYHTGKGGGTGTAGMVHGSRRILGDCGLKMRDAGRLRRHTIVRNVDRGMPVLWIHYASPEFRQRLDSSLRARGRATPEGWKKLLSSQKRVRQSTAGAHIALVIGYNRDTDEFAVSNSWGDRYRIAWVRYSDMEQADAKTDLFIVVPKK